jgi:hypothetical protein
MATSTNYGWAEPDNTSLVKDGAQAIRTLGDAIDTSLWNSGYGQAGKNKLINGDFFVNQRNFTSGTAGGYSVDRWSSALAGDGTSTQTLEAFTPGAAPVAGYEAKNYIRVVTTGQTNAAARTSPFQWIEDVRTFAGQTATVSFWAKAATGTPSIAIEFSQSFGTGGSPSATVRVTPQKVAITTSWVRYSLTFAVPSISGKTIGTTPNTSAVALTIWLSAGSDNATRSASIGIQSNTFDIWGVQVEYGSKATPFQTASGGSIQGELAMCQRYYEKSYDLATAPGTATSVGSVFSSSITGAVTASFIGGDLRYKMTKRTTPTLTFYDGAGNSGKLTRETIGGSATNNETASSANIGTNGCVVFSSGSASASAIKFQFTADAEL